MCFLALRASLAPLRAKRSGGRYPESFAIVHQAQSQPFFVPQMKILDFEQPHQGRKVLSAAEDIGRILHQEPDTAAPDEHTADTHVQGVGIGLHGQYAGAFVQIHIYAVGLGGKGGIQQGKPRQNAVGRYFQVEVPGREVATDIAFSNLPDRKLRKPGAAAQAGVKLSCSFQACVRGKGTDKGIHTGVDASVQAQ